MRTVQPTESCQAPQTKREKHHQKWYWKVGMRCAQRNQAVEQGWGRTFAGRAGRRQLRVQDYAKPKYAGAFVNKTHRYARRKKWSGVKRAGLGRVARTSLEGGVLPSSYGPEAN